MAETNFLIPDNSNGDIPVGALPYLNGGNNGLFGGNGWGGGILGFLLKFTLDDGTEMAVTTATPLTCSCRPSTTTVTATTMPSSS